MACRDRIKCIANSGKGVQDSGHNEEWDSSRKRIEGWGRDEIRGRDWGRTVCRQRTNVDM